MNKITLDKNVITLAELNEAKEMAKDFQSWLDNDAIESFANRALKNVINGHGRLIKINNIEITKNHYKLCCWCEVIIKTFDMFFVTSFDLSQANNGEEKIDNYTQVYELKKS